MSSIKGVMLLPLDAASYSRHMAHHAFMAKANSRDRTYDPRQDLTQLVEDRVREEVQRNHRVTSSRVLRWEQRSPDNRYVEKFRELDGVFRHEERTAVLLEVKASASANCLKSGLSQLRAAVELAARVNARTVGLLAVANLGLWIDLFGQAPGQPLVDYFRGKEVELLEWPPRVPTGKASGLCVVLVPDATVHEWLLDELALERLSLGMVQEG